MTSNYQAWLNGSPSVPKNLNKKTFLLFPVELAGEILKIEGNIYNRYDRDDMRGHTSTFGIEYNGECFEVEMRNGEYISVTCL
jgi:hypothetical protein